MRNRNRWAQARVAALILLWWLTPVDASGAGSAAADASVSVLDLGPLSQVIRDEAGTLTARDLLASPGVRPSSGGETMNSFGVTTAAYWFVISLENPTGAPLTRLLVVDPSWLDDIRTTLVDPDGELHEQRGGTILEFAARAVPHRKINLELTLAPGSSRLLVRAQNRGPFVVGMTLWEREAFLSADGGEPGYAYIIYSILGAMLLFNLVLYLSVRDKVYAAYVVYLLSFMLAYAGYNGYMFQHVWPGLPRWSNWFNAGSIYLFAAAALYFALQFLELRSRMPRLHWLGQAGIVLILVSMVVNSVATRFDWDDGGLMWVLVCALFSLFVGLQSLLTGNRSARYFVPATALGFMGSLVSSLAASGYVPFNIYTFHAVDFGMSADALLLSLALADRLRLARAAAEQARAELLEATRSHAQQLVREVDERTRELRASNAAKDKFFSIIAHDLRGPVRSLVMLYSDVVRSPADFNEDVLALTRVTANNTSHLLDHLLMWARSQRGEIDCNPSPICLRELMGETQGLYLAEATARGIALHLDVADDCELYADPAMVRTILRNLISNALKFTPRGGSITVTAARQGGYCEIRVTDTGIGMSEQVRQSLFRIEAKSPVTPGVQGERGTGLGLILCGEFVERNQGTITVESRVGEGTTVAFTLPAL